MHKYCAIFALKSPFEKWLKLVHVTVIQSKNLMFTLPSFVKAAFRVKLIDKVSEMVIIVKMAIIIIS